MSAPSVLWDVFQEHLDEAAWLWGEREASLDSPVYSIAEVAGSLEERVLAHLDGLVLGGKPVADKLLLPALAGDEPEHVPAPRGHCSRPKMPITKMPCSKRWPLAVPRVRPSAVHSC
jgi:hypothetical protein